MGNIKRLVVVRPDITYNVGSTTSFYSYPNHSKIKTNTIAFNRSLEGSKIEEDQLAEQMWIVQGDSIDVNNFTNDRRVTMIRKDQAVTLGSAWNPEVLIINEDAIRKLYKNQSIVNSLKSIDLAFDPRNPKAGVSYKRKWRIIDWNVAGAKEDDLLGSA